MDKHYVWYDTHSYHSCIETDFNARVNEKIMTRSLEREM